MVNAAVRLWTSQPTKRSIADRPPCPTRSGRERCGAGFRNWIVVLARHLFGRSETVAIPLLLRGASTTTYASSKLNRVGRRAARYDSGLSAHRCKRPAHKRPTPHRIAHERIACSRSRCGNSTPSTALFPLPPVNLHPSPVLRQPPLRHNHARYDAMNRLATSAATGSTTYNLAFSYDRYGNMTCVTNGQTNGPCPNYSFNTSTNQISNGGYS